MKHKFAQVKTTKKKRGAANIKLDKIYTVVLLLNHRAENA